MCEVMWNGTQPGELQDGQTDKESRAERDGNGSELTTAAADGLCWGWMWTWTVTMDLSQTANTGCRTEEESGMMRFLLC